MTDLLLYNGMIPAIDFFPIRGNAIAVRNGKILAVGEASALKTVASPSARKINLRGKAILPGFIDAHIHLRALAESLVTIPLNPKSGVSSISDVISRIHDYAQKLPQGAWIRGGGYNEAYLAEKRHPDRLDLDRAAPHHPVKLTHRSGHAHVLNSLGLKFAGIHRSTDDPPQGIIDRNLENGEPTGVLWGLNEFLLKRIPPVEDHILSRGVELAEQQLLSNGITSFQDASPRNDRSRWRWYEGLKHQGLLKPRTAMMLGIQGFHQHVTHAFKTDIHPDDFCLCGVKVVIDETTGMLNPDLQTLFDIVCDIHREGHQMVLHAIEPSAILAAVEAVSNALAIYPRENHRHRIEHCSVCPPELIAKIASLGLMVTTHPAFLYYSGDRYLKTVPENQQPYLYPIASLIHAGVCTAAASDSPIADVSPIKGIYSAVTRLSENGKALLIDEGISVREALRMYTIYSARAFFQEKKRGAISPGNLADFTVLTHNPLAVPEQDIKDIQVEMTIIGGEVVWTR